MPLPKNSDDSKPFPQATIGLPVHSHGPQELRGAPSSNFSGSWWVLPRPNRLAKLRLLCFPYAGGHASVFRQWSLAMPGFVEVFALQPPGRANRITEAAITSLPEFMEKLGPVLAPLTDKPFAMFGHSMGAILSFEACCWLRRNGLNLPEHLFVSARRAPHIVDPANIHTMSDDDFLSEIGRLKGTPDSILQHHALLRLLLPSLRADFTLCEAYCSVSSDPLPLPITAFGGTEDEETQEGRLEGWQQHTSARFSSHKLPGDHFFIHSQEKMLIGLVSRYLAQMA